MTTLALVQERVIQTSPMRRFLQARERFLALNHNGRVTILVIGAIASAAILYVAGTYWMMDAGFSIKEQQKFIAAALEEIVTLDIAVRQREASFAESHPEVIGSMEKSVGIRYVAPKSVASRGAIETP